MTPAKVPRVKDVSSPNSNSLAFRKKSCKKYFFSNQGLTYLFIFEVHTWCSVGEKGIDINVGKALRELY